MRTHEADAALAFAKSIDINGLADFNKLYRRKKKRKRLDENPYSAAVLDIYRYYAKEIIPVLCTML